jgi:hypothetical protein
MVALPINLMSMQECNGYSFLPIVDRNYVIVCNFDPLRRGIGVQN